MKKRNIFLLASLFIMSPILFGCSTRNDLPEENKQDVPDENKPEVPESKPEEPSKPDVEDETKPLPLIELKTIKEANALCENVIKDGEENFVSQKIRIRGQVLSDFAISSSYHFMIFADETGTLPILINSNKDTTKKYWINSTYEVIGNVGNYKNVNCLNVGIAKPTIINDTNLSNLDLSLISKSITINDLYNEAYKIEVNEKKPGFTNVLYKIEGFYTNKINENLFLVFDGEKHIILHGDNKVNNSFQNNFKYEFYVFPTTFSGKRGAEFAGAKSLNIKDESIILKMKEKAIDKTINSLYNISEENDNKQLYPYIIKVSCYVSAHCVDNGIHLAFVDDLKNNPSYENTPTGRRPKAIYAKNHVLDGTELSYQKSILGSYYLNQVKGEFYFVATEYQTSYHVYQAFVLDDLIEPLIIEN